MRLTWTLLCAIALGETWPLPVLRALGLAVAVAMATMNVLLKGVVVELIEDRLRPSAAIKIRNLHHGRRGRWWHPLVGIFELIGWTASFLTIAGVPSLGLLHKAGRRSGAGATDHQRNESVGGDRYKDVVGRLFRRKRDCRHEER